MLQGPKDQPRVAAELSGGQCVLPLAAAPASATTYSCDARTLPETRVWGSKPEKVHCSSATSRLKIELRWGCEECSGKTAVGSGVSFKYDPFGRRIYKSSSSGTSVYAYDGDNFIEETNSSGGVVARYAQTQNVDEPLAMLRSSTTSYYQADGLDSVSSLSNAAGALAQTYTFDSFGNTTATTGSLTNPFRYTGREFDSETSLYYMRARYFDPATGRFISEDPITFTGGINFYRYAKNNPGNLVDPFGLNPAAPAIPFPWVLPYPIAGPLVRAVGGFIGLILGELAFPDATGIDDARAIPKARPIPCDKNKRDCAQEWADAYAMCRELLARPHPPRAMTGGYPDLANCARGLVSEECGGNPVGGKKK
jgi:RHS repeat-associated protein